MLWALAALLFLPACVSYALDLTVLPHLNIYVISTLGEVYDNDDLIRIGQAQYYGIGQDALNSFQKLFKLMDPNGVKVQLVKII